MESILRKMLQDKTYLEKINRRIDKRIDIIKGKKVRNADKQGFTKEEKFIEEMARSRISARNKYSRSKKLFLDSYSLSYSTPEIVGIYRSNILRGNKILDLGCGAGMQAIMLSKYSDVTGVDINTSRIMMAQLNNLAYGTNVKFTVQDAMALNLEDKMYDIIFCDPLRPKDSEERTLNELVPEPTAVISRYERFVKNFVFDLPPFIAKDKISSLGGTLEYLTVDGNLNRLTLYYKADSQRTFRAVSLPSDFTMESDTIFSPLKTETMKDFLFVPDASLFYSGLHGNYCNSLGLELIWTEKRKAVYTSTKTPKDFIGEAYRVLDFCNTDELLNAKIIQKYEFVFFRYSIPDYYEQKRIVESHMSGSGNLYLFRNDQILYFCEKLNE